MARTLSQDRSAATNPMTRLSTVYGYGMAMAISVVAGGLTLAIRYGTNSPTFFIFYAAIFVSIWSYGRGPGWLTTVLACAVTLPLFPDQSSAAAVEDAALPTGLPTVLAFVLCATTADWISTRRHRTEAELRAARDGLEQTVLERTHALRDANQRLSVEIEVRRRVESELRTSEKWWRKIFESSNVPIGVTDLNGYHLMANSATERTLGYTLEELRNLTIAELTHEDDRARTLPAFDSLARGAGREYRVIKRYRCKDGSVKWLDASVTRLQYPRSGEDVIVGVINDITEQKRIEAELRRSEERWRAMFAHAPTAIAMVGADYRLTETNPACRRILGYSEDEFRELTPMDISLDDERDLFSTLLSQLINGTRESTRAEKRCRTKDGGLVWADVTFFHVPATEGSPAFATAIAVDITERKRAEEALRRTQSELARAGRIMSMGELTASIAHEVNQPLAAIVASGNACRRWLAAEPPNLTRAKESLNRIVEDANRASEVITRIRAHTKNTSPEQVELWINDVVEDVLFLARGELEARLIKVQMELDHDLAPVLGDKVQLQQVILNLTMNAVEAMTCVTDRQRVLTMKSHKVSPTEVRVIVRDNGPGLNLGDSDRIFDTFFTTKSDGMGMGLSISRSIIEAHGGRLWTLPASPHGTEFHLSLPMLGARE